MKAVYEFIIWVIRWVLVAITFICVDIPLKIILYCICLMLAVIVGILYPVFKHITFSDWIGTVWNYATGFKIKVCDTVYDMWS